MTSLFSFTSAFSKQKHRNCCFQRVQMRSMRNDLAIEMAKFMAEWLAKRQKKKPIRSNELFQPAYARSKTVIIATTVFYGIFSKRDRKSNDITNLLWLLLIAATTILLTMGLLSRTSK